MRVLTSTAVLMLTLGLLVGGATAAPGAYHQDDRLGYKIRVPRDWETVPIQVDEQWIVAKFLSDKADYYTDPEGWTFDHKPIMTSIAFVTEIVEGSGIEKSESDEGALFIEIKNPYKDYPDYLRRTYSGGGWYVSDEEEDDVKGVKVTKMEIKVEKLTMTGPRRIVTWVYHLEGVDVAVQFEMIEDSYDDHKREVFACLKSFREVPRTTGSLAPVTTGDGIGRFVDESKMSPDEREAHRQEIERVHHEKAKEGLPEGWTAKEMGPFLVINHVDDKYAKKVVAHAEAVWKWLDKTFPYIGEDEYVPRPIIRICKNRDEESAFRSGDWFGMGIEIVTHKDVGAGALSYEFEWVNKRILSIWFNYHDRDLFSALPHWLDSSLSQVLGTARASRSSLEFQEDDWERERLREAVRGESLTPPRTLMTLGASDFYEGEHRSTESAALLRFFLTGAASRNRRTKTVLEDYIKNLRAVITEIQEERASRTPEEYQAPETEEEEEERYRAQRQAWKDRESELLTQVFERTFGEWDDRDWATFDKVYYKSLD